MAETSNFDLETVPVCFNMDLANAPTSARFCREAASVLGETLPDSDEYALDSDGELTGEIVDEWTNKLDAAGYAVFWNAGDVVVYDLRNLSDDERDAFYSATENY